MTRYRINMEPHIPPHRRQEEPLTTDKDALVARFRAALKLIYPDDITPMGRRMLERILDEEAGSTPPCHNCGDTTRIKAKASRGDETRYFCHDSEKSCYNAYRGNYFAD